MNNRMDFKITYDFSWVVSSIFWKKICDEEAIYESHFFLRLNYQVLLGVQLNYVYNRKEYLTKSTFTELGQLKYCGGKEKNLS